MTSPKVPEVPCPLYVAIEKIHKTKAIWYRQITGDTVWIDFSETELSGQLENILGEYGNTSRFNLYLFDWRNDTMTPIEWE